MFNQGIPKDKEKLFWISSFDIFVLCFVTWQPYTRLTPIISTWSRKMIDPPRIRFLDVDSERFCSQIYDEYDNFDIPTKFTFIYKHNFCIGDVCFSLFQLF